MRIYMRRRAGFRAPRGGHVIDLQKAISQGSPVPVSVDGVFGQQSETALAAWQARNGLTPSGMVDELSWNTATAQSLPSYFRRCLAITAAFEGHGYTFAAGNWDNAYLTWGVVGFTLKGGNLGKVIKTIHERHPQLLRDTIGDAKTDELLEIIDASATRKRDWGNSISLPPSKYRIRGDWEDAFRLIGERREVRVIQDEIARSVYWRQAVKDLRRYGKPTEADAALFFDTAVQNGSVNAEKAEKIEAALAANPGVDGRDRLMLIARAIAAGSNPDFHDDVLSRRATIASGQGTVHGSAYKIEDWFVDYVEVEDASLD